ncbi:MAG: hypothetical protein K9H61_01420 [Bacteroidia bacterium]|nr:hypothetical protein [Bacteroidia bacterium]MCF8425849.1 hypothetical protein [Bacteroidia bacterium]MCF8445628.1 hypothetical protein [Bacteroidia bacterium]
MKKYIFLLSFLSFTLCSFAQFGTFKKKEDVEKFKDTRLVVVLFPDSAYSASVIAAVERYWTFTGYEFAEDTALYRYKKGDYAFMYFSKSKGSKIKTRIASSEEDMNAMVITRKFSRRVAAENLLVYGFCSNRIDTADWEFETTRAVQLMNNYLNYAIEAKSNSDLSSSKMMSDYPSDKSQLVDKKLLIEDRQLELKGKEEATTLFDGDVEEVDYEEIHKAIRWQDNSYVYFYYSKDEKYCNKLVVSAANSELMYFTSESPEKCKCNAKDLKELKNIKVEALKPRN